MFAGHIAVGLAAKPAAPRTSLGTLVLAAVLLDVLVWMFVVAGLEHIAVKPGLTATNALDLYDYPFSHSLLMSVVWGALMAGTYYEFRKYWRGTLLIFAAVVSHWVLDFVSHRPDMPLVPGIHRCFNRLIGRQSVDSPLARLECLGVLRFTGQKRQRDCLRIELCGSELNSVALTVYKIDHSVVDVNPEARFKYLEPLENPFGPKVLPM